MACDSTTLDIKNAEKLLKSARGCDRHRLSRRLRAFERRGILSEDWETFIQSLLASVEDRRRRSDAQPDPQYPSSLPIVERRDEIVHAIRQNQVIILSGETGSGKTTQIPKMCLEAGRGIDGLIGCTQPRRIAALTVAARIAEELGDSDNKIVATKIRFHESGSKDAYIKIMTDGILLAETQGDPWLSSYDTLIIDEAHERSLNIDVLIGMVRRLVKKRPELKVVVTSATLDTEKFSRAFDDAPIIEVSGRTYPVEILYSPPDPDNAEETLAERTASAVGDLVSGTRRGDILAFLPTEQDIKETMEIACNQWGDRLDVIPLYARLPASEQRLAFSTGGRRKLVVATNVAETSLTIPGVKYVVDSGLARISRYSPGTGTHGLPIDPISQASANQRAGRCGRVEDGICIRLYSEEDYESRSEYTPPEIKRTNLAEVILRLLSLGIEDIEGFPFIDPPEAAAVRDGLKTLNEVKAVMTVTKGKNKHRRLTKEGKLMARLPLDPRLSRVLLQADGEGCLGDVLPIAAALTLQDPRERPKETPGKADKAHEVFVDSDSDFLGWLNIWDGFRSFRQRGSYSSKLKKYCKDHYLSFRRMREWMDIHRQLTLVMEDAGFRPHRLKEEVSRTKNGGFSRRYQSIHRSLISGFLSHIAQHQEKGEYLATRNRKARIHPGSAVGPSRPQWIVAAEMVRTTKLYARSVAAIDPLWLDSLANHVMTYSWKNPHWSRKAGAVMAERQSRLFGFLVGDGMILPYGEERPEEARDIFIRKALVEEDLGDRGGGLGFLKANRRLLKRLRTTEDKLRRRDLIAGDDAVAAFYDQNLPKSVLDLQTLNAHLKTKGESHLLMTEDDLVVGDWDVQVTQQFPTAVNVAGEKWSLSYVFDPDSPQDGVTLKVPAGRLADLPADKLDWLVPGLLEQKIEALLRGLPKAYRRKLIPIPETAKAALNSLDPEGRDLIRALTAWIYKEYRLSIPLADWEPASIPEHLNVRVSLLDEHGREATSGRTLGDLQSPNLKTIQGGRIDHLKKIWEIEDLQAWPDKDIPQEVSDRSVQAWPALHEDHGRVSLHLFRDKGSAAEYHLQGQVALGRRFWARELRDFRRSLLLSGDTRSQAVYFGGPKLVEDAVWNKVTLQEFGSRIVRTRTDWEKLVSHGGHNLYDSASQAFASLTELLSAFTETRRTLVEMKSTCHRPSYVDQRIEDLGRIVPRDFLNQFPVMFWSALPRLLKGLVSRTRKGAADPKKDQRGDAVWQPLWERWLRIESELSSFASEKKRERLMDARIMLEELHVALFAAGEVRAVGKPSEKKVSGLLDEIEGML